MTNKEKFLALVDKEENKTVERAKARLTKKNYTKLSRSIAIAILAQLDELGWRQVTLAGKMGVSAQQVNKWVKGKENFTIDTLVTLSDILGINLIEVSAPALQTKKELATYQSSEDYAVIAPVKQLKLQITMREEMAYENRYQIA